MILVDGRNSVHHVGFASEWLTLSKDNNQVNVIDENCLSSIRLTSISIVSKSIGQSYILKCIILFLLNYATFIHSSIYLSPHFFLILDYFQEFLYVCSTFHFDYFLINLSVLRPESKLNIDDDMGYLVLLISFEGMLKYFVTDF